MAIEDITLFELRVLRTLASPSPDGKKSPWVIPALANTLAISRTEIDICLRVLAGYSLARRGHTTWAHGGYWYAWSIAPSGRALIAKIAEAEASAEQKAAEKVQRAQEVKARREAKRKAKQEEQRKAKQEAKARTETGGATC